jgi:hypothetical protein
MEMKVMKETPELVTESWQLLVEYIPRKDHSAAAEHYVSYLYSVLSKEELEAMSDLDSDLGEAYQSSQEELTEDDFYETYDEYSEDED